MKKNVLMVVLGCLCASQGFSQYDQDYAREFKPVKVGVGVGYAAPGATEGGSGGFLAYVEPSYRATDQVAVSVRLEGAFLLRGLEGVEASDALPDESSIVSFTLNSYYYVNDGNLRPFVGAGVGLFHLAAANFRTSANGPDADDIAAETRFGFYPRLGLDAGHLTLTLDYNVVPPTDVPGGGEVKNNYFGLRAGFSIGGGKKKVQRYPNNREHKKRS